MPHTRALERNISLGVDNETLQVTETGNFIFRNLFVCLSEMLQKF